VLKRFPQPGKPTLLFTYLLLQLIIEIVGFEILIAIQWPFGQQKTLKLQYILPKYSQTLIQLHHLRLELFRLYQELIARLLSQQVSKLIQ